MSTSKEQTSRAPLLQRLKTWFRLKLLERELRGSEEFQRECESFRCFTLAGFEQIYRAEIQEKIRRLQRQE